ncbi:MAG: pyridoxamine 5'-phosphate oxidase [Alphaproteobacteria bacterium]
MSKTADPISRFSNWLEEAKSCKEIAEPTAMCLATVGEGGKPSARMVLLKAADENGFVFYTNNESRKGGELKANPHVALCFYWMPLERQVRVEGRAQPVSDAEADAYFASRGRESRIGAWASKQSRPLSGKAELLKAVAAEGLRFNIGEVPRPPYWSGWRVVPEVIEFWQAGTARLHDRDAYTRSSQGWNIHKLYP